ARVNGCSPMVRSRARCPKARPVTARCRAQPAGTKSGLFVRACSCSLHPQPEPGKSLETWGWRASARGACACRQMSRETGRRATRGAAARRAVPSTLELPWVETVRQNGQLGNIQTLDHLYADAKNGTLPAVSWVTPNGEVSEHPPALVSAGQAYVTGLIDAIMKGPNWNSAAIFLAWDDWGGFY